MCDHKAIILRNVEAKVCALKERSL